MEIMALGANKERVYQYHCVAIEALYDVAVHCSNTSYEIRTQKYMT